MNRKKFKTHSKVFEIEEVEDLIIMSMDGLIGYLYYYPLKKHK